MSLFENMSALQSLIDELEALVGLPEKVESLRSELEEIENRIEEFNTESEERSKAAKIYITELIQNAFSEMETELGKAIQTSPYTFILQADSEGYADTSWKEIITKGQAVQVEAYRKFESFYRAKYGDIAGAPGWHGSARLPVIQIVANYPEYRFRETMVLPPRFQLTSPARWGSILRWEAGTIKDTINWGTATGASIGLIVQAANEVDGCTFRPFEQGIERVTLQAINGVLPVYLEANQDRFWMDSVKILQSEGALLGIKHGPRLIGPPRDEHVWLTDARFTNLQMEGPGSDKTPQAAMLLSGANIIIDGLNLYYWRQGPYLQNDQGATINGLTMHLSGYSTKEIRPYIVSRKTGLAAFGAISCANPGLYVDKQSTLTQEQLGGWYAKPGRVL